MGNAGVATNEGVGVKHFTLPATQTPHPILHGPLFALRVRQLNRNFGCRFSLEWSVDGCPYDNDII